MSRRRGQGQARACAGGQRAREEAALSLRARPLARPFFWAGMFALPRAFSGLGLLGGAAMVAAVAAMTYYSIVIMLR